MALNNDIKLKKNNTNIFDIVGMLKTTSTVPTYTPTKFSDQFILYVSGATYRLYIYDNTNKAWRYTALT